jgi:uncharacterized membrane protein
VTRRDFTSRILFFGVALSCSFLAVGVLGDFIDPIAFGTIKPGHIPLLLGALAHGSPAAMLHLGILVLLITPVARVVALAWSFARNRELAFAAMSLGVLLLLIVSFAAGAVE